ncbi:MAG: tRNA pseudouridine synthase A [Saprospiraceae bacterium]|nr:tRNA pseudouridine synthase A [Saprospiraceae bacterium]
MRFFIHLAYDGRQYHGWQRQISAISVQETIENLLSEVLKKKVFVTGCGRTDAFVHASQYFMHVDMNEDLGFDLKFRFNKRLPMDIAIFDIVPVAENAHTRFDAVERTYNYFIHTYKEPFLHGLSALYEFPDMDLQKMSQAVALLPQYDDYYGLCKTPLRQNLTICKVSSATLFRNEKGNRIRFQIKSNRFLSGMIRIIMGQLLQIGQGNLSVEYFEYQLKNRITPNPLVPAYPQGLYLTKVIYPYLDLEQQSFFESIHQIETGWIPVE